MDLHEEEEEGQGKGACCGDDWCRRRCFSWECQQRQKEEEEEED